MSAMTAPAFAENQMCKACHTRFNLITRRHHCRNCGESFCDACCSNRDRLPHYGIDTPERTCDVCHKHLVSTSPQGASKIFSIPSQPSVPAKPVGGVPTPQKFTGFSPFPTWQTGHSGPVEYQGTPEEQVREAIKNNDVEAVKRLLEAKAKPGYIDRTGNSLLHIACILDRFPIVKLLCESGASPYVYNTLSKPERPVDIATAALSAKIKKMWPESNYTSN